MAKRMLVDATHPEETRIVVVNGHRVEEFDFETSTKKQLKGNIYLARVTRVEPSLQAAFVEYGGNRHGFLAFSEIHPDYYRIPVADRQALLAAHAADDDDDHHHRGSGQGGDGETAPPAPLSASVEPSLADALQSRSDDGPDIEPAGSEHSGEQSAIESVSGERFAASAENIAIVSVPTESLHPSDGTDPLPVALSGDQPTDLPQPLIGEAALIEGTSAEGLHTEGGQSIEVIPPAPQEHQVESIGGDEVDDAERRRRHRIMRHYKIQEVIKRRQILLVQVVKEERGTKGAALTTYMSLAGRYCVLMPNTSRGGGISRRITNAQDRRRLKQIMEELQLPEGMAVILRTAGMERSNAEIKRDYEYLMRMWDEIRELTLRSTAPNLVYEEGNLVKRAIRDLYSSDIEEILVEGEQGYDAARAFMNMLMPDHIDRVRLYNDPSVPLLQRFQVENELDNIHSPTVRLRSGGYIVINQTEALVAIDVNSGRSTRERHIEETAYRTNLEAAEEIARQLRLRDLAGLIVIDFIDMDEHRNQHAVERRVKDAMRSDRARIQIGRISPFGLLELSRQRLRPSLAEVSSEVCPHCGGTGRVRSTESTALHVLRGVEEEGMRMRTAEAIVHVPSAVALYLLNHKREALQRIETRYAMKVIVAADEALIPPAYRLDRSRARDGAREGVPSGRPMAPAPIRADIQHHSDTPYRPHDTADAHEDEEIVPPRASEGGQQGGEYNRDREREREGGEAGGRGRRRRRRRGGRGGDQPFQGGQGEGSPQNDALARVPDMSVAEMEADAPAPLVPGGDETQGRQADGAPRAPRPQGEGAEGTDEQGRRRRRRGRRGGRRRHGEGGPQDGAPALDQGGQPVEPAFAPEAVQSAPPVVIGPGHDLPPDSPLAAPRIEGPGDAHDWPWNRRNERFPEDPRDGAPAARTDQFPEDRSHITAPPPVAPPPVAEPVFVQPAPMMAAPEAPPPPPPRQEAAPQPEPEPDEPKGPPRKGWWKRLTE